MVVSTLSVLTGSAGRTAVLHQALGNIFTPLTAYCFMAFTLLYTPCISTIAAMRREFGSIKWTVGTVLFDFSMAWVVTFALYHAGLLLGL
jgi:ferrous iron transport protein B